MAKDFHHDMADYLDDRLGEKKHFSDMFKKKEKKAEFKDIDEVEDEIDQLEEQQEQMDDEYEDQGPKRPGFFSRLFGTGMSSDDMDEMEMEEARPELEEDVKKVLRISFDWINQLPPDKKVKFKHSQDFVEYKAVLQKYGLLREQKEVEHAQER